MSGEDTLVDLDSGTIWPSDAASVEEAVVANWFAGEGSRVREGETVCEIQIEKVSVDVPAPVGGTLVAVLVAESEEFRRGDVLGRIRPE